MTDTAGDDVPVPASGLTAAQEQRLRAVLRAVRRTVLEPELDGVLASSREAVRELASAEVATCLVWEEQAPLGALPAAVARHVDRLRQVAASGQPRRWSGSSEGGDATGPWLVVPVTSPERETVALLVAHRAPGAPGFGVVELDDVRRYAQQVVSAFTNARLWQHIEGVAPEPSEPSLFREEAVEAFERGADVLGEVLAVPPGWARLGSWAVSGLLLVAALYMAFGRVGDYAAGPAVVVAHGQTVVTAAAPGMVTDVLVRPGEPVRPGQPIVRLYAAQQQATLERVEREFDVQLARTLETPTVDAQASLAALRAQLEEARARLEERTLTAPRTAVVSDVRVRPGQALAVGDPVASLGNDDLSFELVALVHGRYRPQLEAGMTVQVQLAGYERSPLSLRVETVSDDLVGPQQVRGIVGGSLADGLEPGHPVVVVRARLSSTHFPVGARHYRLHEGMLASAEIEVASRPVFEVLWPGAQGP